MRSDAANMPPPSQKMRVRPLSPSAFSASGSDRCPPLDGTGTRLAPASAHCVASPEFAASSSQMIQTGSFWAVRMSVLPSSNRRWREATMRTGWCEIPRSRTRRSGSSARAVPAPTITASWELRNRWTRARASGPVIHLLSPDAVAMRPSSVMASLSVSIGRPRVTRDRKPDWRARASASQTLSTTSIPAELSIAVPCPATRGSGSV